MQLKKIKTIPELLKKAQEEITEANRIIDALVILLKKYNISPEEEEYDPGKEEQGHLQYQAPTKYDTVKHFLKDIAYHYNPELPIPLTQEEFLSKTRVLKGLTDNENWEIDDKYEWRGLLEKLEAIFLGQI